MTICLAGGKSGVKQRKFPVFGNVISAHLGAHQFLRFVVTLWGGNVPVTKLLVVTSLFLVWALFEMSGGQSFTPGTDRAESRVQEPDVLIEKAQMPAVATVSLEQAVSVETALTDASYVPFHAPIISQNQQVPNVLLASYAEPAIMTDATLVRDIRRVTGDRVNLRHGAGTQHSVVGKANRGDEAEVLTVDGDWAQVHLISTGETGWMASWLLTE